MSTKDKFGTAGGSLVAGGTMAKLGFPLNQFQAGVFPSNPCYEWGEAGWDATKWKLFMYRSGRGDSLDALSAFLADTGAGSFVMMGNEPNIGYQYGQDGQTPREYVDALRAAKAALSSRYFYMMPASIAHECVGVTWTSESGNPYVGGSQRKRYMWDVLTYYAACEGAELDQWMSVHNLHAYGGATGNVATDVQSLIDILDDWHAFHAAYDSAKGTHFASKQVFISELAFDVWTGQSDSYRQAFVNLLYNRLRSNDTAWGDKLIAWAAFYGSTGYDYTERCLIDTNGNLTSYGKEYRIMANCPQCSVCANYNQSIPDSQQVALSFNSEYYDNDNMHSLLTNNGRITINTAGLYQLIANVVFAANGTGRRGVYIRHNGTVVAQTLLDNSGAASWAGQVTVQRQASVGDYFEVVVVQYSGGNLDVVYNTASPTFMAARIGPVD